MGDGGAGRRRPISAAAHINTRRSSAFSRLQGSVRGGVWPGRELVARLIHRSGLRGATEAAAVSSAAEAGLRGEASPVTGVLASRVRHGLRYLQQKTGEVALMLTKGLDGEGCSAGRLAARSGGGPWRSARMGRRGGVSGLLGSSVRLQGCLRGSHDGQGGSGCSDGVELPRRSNSPAASRGLKIWRRRGSDRGKRGRGGS